MGKLSIITEKLNGHPCEKMVKQTGQEIEFSGASFGIGDDTLKFGKFSNKIKEFHKVTSVMVALDNSQYRLCTSIFKMGLSDELKNTVNQIRLQISMGFDQLLLILGSIEENTTPGLEKELEEWVKFMSQLSRQSIMALSPPKQKPRSDENFSMEFTKSRVTESYIPKEEPLEQLMEKICEFQGITKSELDEAAKKL